MSCTKSDFNKWRKENNECLRPEVLNELFNDAMEIMRIQNLLDENNDIFYNRKELKTKLTEIKNQTKKVKLITPVTFDKKVV